MNGALGTQRKGAVGTEEICITAAGIAIYVVFNLCLQVPVFENYYLCLGYISMMVMLYSFGVVQGTLTATLGCIIYCLLTNGLRGMPGWTLGNLVIGLMVGLCIKKTHKMTNKTLKLAVNITVICLATAVGILGIKSLTECILYAQPFMVRVFKNMYAFVADITVLVFSLPFAMGFDEVLKHYIVRY